MKPYHLTAVLVYVTSISEWHGGELHKSSLICIPSWHALWSPAHLEPITPHVEYRGEGEGDIHQTDLEDSSFSPWKNR